MESNTGNCQAGHTHSKYRNIVLSDKDINESSHEKTNNVVSEKVRNKPSYTSTYDV